MSFHKGDVIIALLMCYYLRKQNANSTFARWVSTRYIIWFTHRSIHLPRTHSIISLLIKYTVTTGLATRQVRLMKASKRFCILILFSALAVACLITVGFFWLHLNACNRVIMIFPPRWTQFFADPGSFVFIVSSWSRVWNNWKTCWWSPFLFRRLCICPWAGTFEYFRGYSKGFWYRSDSRMYTNALLAT